VLLQRLQRHCGSLVDAWYLSPASLGEVEGIGPQTLEKIETARSQLNPTTLLREHEQHNPHFWTPADPDYPRLLREIPDPPPVLYYRGRPDLAELRGERLLVAIVGTRRPTEYGRRWTRRIAVALAERGCCIVSGLAEGIDTEAHQAVLSAGGRTIGVLGTGVDIVYPARNKPLFQRIIHQDPTSGEAGGLLLSEYPAGTPPDRAHFPQRNRIVAGLCRAALVLEAPEKSGALITARQASDYGRDVFALPGSLDNVAARGCLQLIANGAYVILDEGHLLSALSQMPPLDPSHRQLNLLDRQLQGPDPAATDGLSSTAAPAPQPAPLPLPDLAAPVAAVFQCLSDRPLALDLIIEQTNLPTSTVSSALLELELYGLAQQVPGMRYVRSP
jgi:DNA processing protein